ncbi:hypothetical protein KY290_023033 [Solanum tuberosum]|uniref:Uncharacterized protein n=1 Tax=Solanum tuberosum TaxID=4113 RepID=A0ABQ7V642_SOLTU|nr:hypothetical protein KY284_021920 [Solanum tuberosum]KAH0684316.1 hypothetical protein KY289_022068 [Solanum tuberosum]KAH0695446.1 hypothetical protein KY285_022543 [Solanum tuberosum]KAH0759540.1 hypothetical protein KY290_023033 [Solanum tuberosum]
MGGDVGPFSIRIRGGEGVCWNAEMMERRRHLWWFAKGRRWCEERKIVKGRTRREMTRGTSYVGKNVCWPELVEWPLTIAGSVKVGEEERKMVLRQRSLIYFKK